MAKRHTDPAPPLQTVEALKEETINAVEGFLQDNPEPKPPHVPVINLDIEGSVEAFTNLMQQLSRAKDSRCGIVQHEIDGLTPLGQEVGRPSKITIRDSRKGNGTKPEDVAESWMEAMAGQARGVVSLLDMNEAERFARTPNDEAVAKEVVVKTFGVYCERLRGASSAKERKKIVTEFNQELVGVLKERGVVIGGQNLANMDDAKVIKIMGDARDFCNLSEKTQNHQVTITGDSEGKGNFVWASMKMNPISEEIRAEYEEVRAYKDNRDSGIHQTPEWFQNLKPYQRELTMKYLDQIMDGDHALPTQLRFLPGLKNAFIDVKGPVKSGKMSDKTYVECHSGTLVHNAGSENSREARRITALNMQHAKDVVGKEKTMVLSVLNTDSFLQAAERNICRIGEEVAHKVEGVEYHQNGVNIASLNPDVSLRRIEKFSVETNKGGQGTKILWTACKSGKDRTFALLMRIAAKIFGGAKPTEFIADLSASSHSETMASSAGATRGAYGLKLKEMFYRMNDELLGAIRGRLTNSISGVNTMHATKLRGEPVYKRMFAELAGKSDDAATPGELDARDKSKREPSSEALAKRAALTERKPPMTPPPPNAVPKREPSRSM